MWEVQTYTFLDGWVNCWTEDEKPLRFATKEIAEQELVEFLEDVHEAVLAGDMEEDYDPDDYRIVEVESGIEQRRGDR